MRAWVDGVLMTGGVRPDDDPAGGPATRSVDGVGDSVFTTVLVRRGQAMFWRRHLDRLATSSQALGLPVIDEELVARAVRETWGAGEVGERVRLRILWGRAHDGSGHLAVRLSALSAPEESIRVITPAVRRTALSALGGHKTTVYAENMLAAGEARRAGADEALLATVEGDLSEGTGTNVFYVVAGELRTPTTETGCLPGIARAVVLDHCEVREIDEEISVAHGAQEVFVTSSTREVQSVREWSGRQYPTSGPVTRHVRDAWKRACVDPGERWDVGQ